ncbi:MAG: hypothetical protein ACJATI_003734 [Halioglobus sp.]
MGDELFLKFFGEKWRAEVLKKEFTEEIGMIKAK